MLEPFFVLRVNLSQRTSELEEVPPELIRAFIGGKGLAAHYIATELPPNVDPFDPGNMLIFMTGPACGIFAGTCRHVVVTKSPATGGFNDTYAGGYLAWEMRKAGLLGLIISGKADRLSYLEIADDQVSIMDASDLAGMTVSQVDDDPKFKGYRVAAIGPAGENLVLFAGIGNNLGVTKNGRSGYNGRAGAGAVMGSKNLKAIAIKGSVSPKISDEAKEVRKVMSARASADGFTFLADVGTPQIAVWTNAVNILPTHNWTSGSFGGLESIGPDAVRSNRVRREACFNCPIRCGNRLKVADGSGAFPGAEADKLEYESLGLCGSNTGNGDFSGLVRFVNLCDEMGMDTISAGACVAFAMDAAEKGYIDHPIRFGDAVGQVKLAEDIAYRRGIGAVLADGVRRAAQTWGVDDADVAVAEVKGLEFPAYDPRGSVGFSLAYATSDRGGCHMRSWPAAMDILSQAENPADPHDPTGKAAFVIAEQDLNNALWSLVACHFLHYNPSEAVFMLRTLGLDMTEDEFLATGRRIWNMVRLFNLKQGWARKDDYAPAFLSKPLLDTGFRLSPETFETMLSDYYVERGWDADGSPTPELIRELELQRYA
jgi:aldehyde:ferredoxin oxidoreductase